MRILRLIVGSFLIGAVFAAMAADVDVGWRWDASGRTEPTPVVVETASSLVETLFRTTAESEYGIIYVGLMVIVR